MSGKTRERISKLAVKTEFEMTCDGQTHVFRLEDKGGSNGLDVVISAPGNGGWSRVEDREVRGEVTRIGTPTLPSKTARRQYASRAFPLSHHLHYE